MDSRYFDFLAFIIVECWFIININIEIKALLLIDFTTTVVVVKLIMHFISFIILDLVISFIISITNKLRAKMWFDFSSANKIIHFKVMLNWEKEAVI